MRRGRRAMSVYKVRCKAYSGEDSCYGGVDQHLSLLRTVQT